MHGELIGRSSKVADRPVYRERRGQTLAAFFFSTPEIAVFPAYELLTGRSSIGFATYAIRRPPWQYRRCERSECGFAQYFNPIRAIKKTPHLEGERGCFKARQKVDSAFVLSTGSRPPDDAGARGTVWCDRAATADPTPKEESLLAADDPQHRPSLVASKLGELRKTLRPQYRCAYLTSEGH